MLRRQLPNALLLSTLLVLAATTGVLGKDDAIVTLAAALPADPLIPSTGDPVEAAGARARPATTWRR